MGRQDTETQIEYHTASMELSDSGDLEVSRRASSVLEIGRNFGDLGAESLNEYFQSPVRPHFSVIPGITFLPIIGY